MLALKGWHPLIVDVKGEDETLHIPARGKQEQWLKAENLQPRGWKTEYFTFCFPYAMESVPMHFQLAPISVKMLSYGHFRSIGGFLSPMEVRHLFDAYLSAGGPDATLEEILSRINLKKFVSPRVISLLTSGFLADSSPLEPARLTEITGKNEFTVLSNAYFSPSSRDLGRFALNVVLDNLMGYLVQTIESSRIIVHFRELREIAPRAGAVGSQWHLKERVENFVTLLRQTRTALTRVFYEVQNAQSVPKTLLDNTQCVFVHPINLKQESQYKELKKYFDIPDKIMHVIGPMTNIKPGKWVFITKYGFADLVNVPPPMSFRMPEPEVEEAEELRTLYSKLVPRRKLTEELEEAKRRYEYYSHKIFELGGKEKMEAMPLPPPETLVLRDTGELAWRFITAIYFKAPLDGFKWFFMLDDVVDFCKDLWGNKGLDRFLFWPSSFKQKVLEAKKYMLQLKIMGFRFFEDPQTEKIGGELDVERFKKHMEKHYKFWIRDPELLKRVELQKVVVEQ